LYSKNCRRSLKIFKRSQKFNDPTEMNQALHFK